MIDELTIYNLSLKHPNTVDLVREVERITRAEIFNEIMPILIYIVDKEGCCYGYEQEIDRLECEWKQLKEQKYD